MDDLATTLAATLTFRTTRDGFTDPLQRPISVDIELTDARRRADARRLHPIVLPEVPVQTPLGTLKDTITVSRHAGGIGTFDPASGALEIPIELRFRHTIPAGDSTLKLTLTTGTSVNDPLWNVLTGAAADRSTTPVALRLVAIGSFVGGALDGQRCAIELDGTLDPSPF